MRKMSMVLLGAGLAILGTACAPSEAASEHRTNEEVSQGYTGPTGGSVFVSQLREQYPDNTLNGYSDDVLSTWGESKCTQLNHGLEINDLIAEETSKGVEYFDAKVGVTFAVVFICREHRQMVD